MIQFLLDDQLITLNEGAPDQTVLEYLRTTKVQRGTKEGCASGDCGACTVVVAEPADASSERLNYTSINSCITFVGTLHGKQLITVEQLQQDDTLHPVQQALVNTHGSQCGFCTPGFVMSMFALGKQVASADSLTLDRHSVDRALAGNLCRCTGYRPIIDAALSLQPEQWQDRFHQQEQSTCQRLKRLRDEQPVGSLQDQGQAFFAPTSADTLAQLLLQYPDAQLLAGGTDLALSVTQQLKQPTTLVYTGNVAELKVLELNETHLRVGAAVSYSQLEPLLKQVFPEFAALLDRLGSLQIRNQGTLAGNVANASPIGDTPPVLLALDAVIHIRCGDQRSSVPIEHFFTGYRQTALPRGGFIESIEIPLKEECYRRVYKVSKRIDDDISAVCAALSIKLEQGVVSEARLGYGGMAATPARALAAEQALVGRPFTEEGIRPAQQALVQDFNPIDDVRASAAYRLLVAQNLLLRAVLEYAQEQNPSDQPQSLEVVHYA